MTAPPVYLLEELHMVAGVDRFVRFEVLTEARFVRVPRQCLDCLGTPCVIPPDRGYQGALLLLHTDTCPAFRALLRRRGGPE